MTVLERIREGDRVTIALEHGREVAGKATMHGGQWYVDCRHASVRATAENVRLVKRRGRVVFQVLDKEVS